MNTQSNEPTVLKVGAATDPVRLAGAIAGLIRQFGTAEVQAIGAGAVNQMVKAVAVARGYVASQGKDLSLVPSFLDMEIGGDVRTVMRARVKVTDL